jgi:phage tail sheath gpL-like
MSGNIIIAGLPSSRKTPGVYMSVILGGPGAGNAAVADRMCCMGNMLTSDIVLTTPAMTIPKGSGTGPATPTVVFSESDAISKFGRGSELHLMCAAAFAQDPNTPLWATPVATAGGAVAATTTLTITGTVPTASVTIDVNIDGKKASATVDAAATIASICTAIAQAVLDMPDMPVTAQSTATTVVFTAKHPGARGLLISVKLDLTSGTRGERLRTGGLAATMAGTTFTMSAATLATAGAGVETTTFATALAAMASERFHRIALAMEDSTNIVAAGAQVTTKAGPTQMLWEQVVAGNTRDAITGGVGALAVAAAALNPRVQIAWHFNSDRSPGVIAASVAAARLMGDSNIGGTCVGEVADCAANLDGTWLAAVPVQEFVDERPIPAEIEFALNYGVCVLAPSVGRPGFTEIVRSVTTRFKDATGALNYAVLDTSEVTVTDHVAEVVRGRVLSTYQRSKLGNDSADGTPPKVKGIVTPSMLKSFTAAILREEEEAGHIINVDKWMANLSVERDTIARGRANAEIPVEPAPSFHQFGGNVRQLAS